MMLYTKFLAFCMIQTAVVLYFFEHHELDHYTKGSPFFQLSSSQESTRRKKSVKKMPNNYYFNGTHTVLNQWYGWQPKLQTPMECPWSACLYKNNTCKTCRDSQLDLQLKAPLIHPRRDKWIPDVTMLRRMYEDGHDSDGNPWPPPLDDGLCRAMDEADDGTKEVLDVIPIQSAPVPRSIPDEDNSKVLTMIYTMRHKHATLIRAMRETWAPEMDGFLAFSTVSDPRIPAISIPHKGLEEYKNMWQKIRSMWKFVGKHYLSQFDWFYIAGDDTIVFPRNLKKYLATFNSSEYHFLGKRFQPHDFRPEIGFNVGGAGYALSRPALECLLEHLDDEQCEPQKRTYAEDWLTARCLALRCNITFEDTRDDQKRERFHYLKPALEYDPNKGKMEWYYDYTKGVGGDLLGKDCCAPDTVSFHRINTPGMVRFLHHYVHHCNRSAML